MPPVGNITERAPDCVGVVPLVEVELDPPLVGNVSLSRLNNDRHNLVLALRPPVELKGLRQAIRKAVERLVLRQLPNREITVEVAVSIEIRKKKKTASS